MTPGGRGRRLGCVSDGARGCVAAAGCCRTNASERMQALAAGRGGLPLPVDSTRPSPSGGVTRASVRAGSGSTDDHHR